LQGNSAGTIAIEGLAGAQSLDSTIYWAGDAPSLSLLAWTADASGVPAHYVGFVRESIAITPSQPVSWSPKLAAVDEITVTGSAQTGPDQTLYEAYPVIRFGKGLTWAFISNEGPRRTAPWTFVVPKIDGAELGVLWQAFDTGRPGSSGGGSITNLSTIAADGTMAPVTLPSPPLLTAPADNSGDAGPGTTFSWTGDGICTVSLEGAGVSPHLSLVTRGTSVTMPDLSSIGFTLPKLVHYTWLVDCRQPAAGEPDLTENDYMGGGFDGRSVVRTIVTRQ
jgi:hypothetical protein